MNKARGSKRLTLKEVLDAQAGQLNAKLYLYCEGDLIRQEIGKFNRKQAYQTFYLLLLLTVHMGSCLRLSRLFIALDDVQLLDLLWIDVFKHTA
jgi:hypothetical protein